MTYTENSLLIAPPGGNAHNPTGQGWASPGVDYGERIAAVARVIRNPL